MISRLAITLAPVVLLAGLPAQSTDTADAPPAVREDTVRNDYDAVDDYIGLWRSDRKTPDGRRPFHFEYELRYFSPDKLIVEMKIHQIFDDGEKRLLWHGYKGWNRIEKETFYHGFSPQGRVSSGRFMVSEDGFVTFYTGYGPKGGMVEVRDVFSSVSDGKFINVTWLRPKGEAKWRIVARDTWTRMPPG